jgi:uncharacterized protein involved in exopolysaccharide biosynthesis
MQLEARWQRVVAMAKAGEVATAQTDVLASAIISSLRAREAQAAGILAASDQRLGPHHPDVLRAVAELSSVRAQITAEAQRVTMSLNSQL